MNIERYLFESGLLKVTDEGKDIIDALREKKVSEQTIFRLSKENKVTKNRRGEIIIKL